MKTLKKNTTVGLLIGSLAMVGSVVGIGQAYADGADEPSPVPNLPLPDPDPENPTIPAPGGGG
jgi:hypothetical protein